MDIRSTVKDIKAGKVKSFDLVKSSIEQAKANSNLNIFLRLYEDEALQAAKDIDSKIAAGEAVGELAGIPFALKDNFLVKGKIASAASKMLADYKADYTATSVQKLLDQGAILIGAVNLDSFAHGTSTENSHFGPTKNPKDDSRVPGGSSGGSAAVVAAGIVPFALGSDTGGSIRLPASFCGVVGFKPSYGLVSRYGVVAMASSTDCIGVLANNMQNTQLVMQIIKGMDSFDSTTIDSGEINFLDQKEAPGKKVAIIKELTDNLSDSARESFFASIDKLKGMGYEVNHVSIPSINLALACYYVLVPAEVSSNLSRYDGLVYGQRPENSHSLDDFVSKSRAQGFEPENKRRIMIGTYVLSSGYFDAYYKKAQRLRTKLIEEFETASKQGLLVSPVAPYPAFMIGDKADDPVEMYMADIMTVSANLVGAPAISVPGQEIDGLPFGFQIMARHGQDEQVINLATEMEAKK